MKLKALVLEDTLSDQLALEIVFEQYPEIQVKYANNSKSFKNLLIQEEFDLFVLDIMLDESLTGIDLINEITNPDAWVTLISSYPSKDFFQDYKDFKFNKFYLNKPLDEFVFRTNLESFLLSKTKDKDYLTVNQGNFVHKVIISDILLIQTTDHATTIYTKDKKFTSYRPLSEFSELLIEKGFEKANRNSLINLVFIDKINFKDNLIYVGDNKISISRGNRPTIFQKFSEKASSLS